MITSKDNEIIKHINKLKHKKYRNEFSEYIIEGKKTIEEALQYAENEVIKIISSESYATKNNIPRETEIISDELYEYISEQKTAEGILGIVNKKEKLPAKYDEELIILLDDIQDPGNLGTILRTLDSLNISQIIISENTVDPYMPKVVSSTMGSIFRINIIKTDLYDEIDILTNKGYKVMSSVLDDTAKSIYSINEREKIALIIGNESHGVSKEYIDKTEKVYIPMLGKTESLNAAMATGIMSYEIYRQKGLF